MAGESDEGVGVGVGLASGPAAVVAAAGGRVVQGGEGEKEIEQQAGEP